VSVSKLTRRLVKPREALAIMPEELQSNREAMWWDSWTSIPANTRCGTVAVVAIRGSLDHHSGHGRDSYEAILERVRCAFTGEDVTAAARQRSYWDEDVVVPEPSPPSAVVLRIDSPGGVVSGLNQTVFALRAMAKRAGIPLIAYADEMAASAAYALACSGEEIVIPPAGVAGSVGVISTMFDQVAADAKMGLRFVTLTSGARKADGHPHVPISDAAQAAELRRVEKLARQFYKLVAAVRPLSVKDLEGLEAGIFLGKEAVRAGLADAVMSWGDFIATLGGSPPVKRKLAESGQSESHSKNNGTSGATRATEKPMSLVALKALVTRTEAALKKEADPKKKAALTSALAAHQASVEAYKKTKYVKETEEEESGGDEEDEDEEEKGNETDRKEGDEPPGDDDDDPDGDEEDEDEDEEEEEAKASAEEEEEAKKSASAIVSATGLTGTAAKAARVAIRTAVKAALERARSRRSSSVAIVDAVRKMTGKRSAGAIIATLQGRLSASAEVQARVAALEKDARQKRRTAMIDEAVAQRRITRSMAATLRTKKMAFVESYLAMHKGALVNIDEESARVPDGTPNADLPTDTLKSIETAVAAANLPNAEAMDKRRAALILAHRERVAKMNGAAGKVY
jgi:ClpP class serine protease